MPSTFKHPAHVPMWKGAKVAYFFIAMCVFPVAIGGFWAYGNLVSFLATLEIPRLFDNVHLNDNIVHTKMWYLQYVPKYMLHIIVYFLNLCSLVDFSSLQIYWSVFCIAADAFWRDTECIIRVPQSWHPQRATCNEFPTSCVQLFEQFSDILYARIRQFWSWLH